MTEKFYYRVYGLDIESDIVLPGAMPWEVLGKPDVVVQLGQIPDFLKGSREAGYGTWTNGQENAWFYTPGAAEFYVEKGNKIIIAPIEDPNWDLVSSLLLSAGLSLIILQRGQIMFHGSSLEYNGNAFIISGESGAGKSTITAELLQKPYGFLADDTVRVHSTGSTFVAEPSYPQQKMCRDMAVRLGLDLKKLRYIDEERDKFARMVTDRYLTDSVPLKYFFVLRIDPSARQVYSRRLTGAEYLQTLVHSFYLDDTYNYIVGFPPELMQQLITLAGQVQVYAVYRPSEGNSIQDVTGEVEKLISAEI